MKTMPITTTFIVVYDQYGDVRIFRLTKKQCAVFETYIDPTEFVRDHMAERFGIETDNSFIFARLCEYRVLSQESIARMDGVYALCLSQRDDLRDAQISIYWCLAFTDLVGLISHRSEECVLILF